MFDILVSVPVDGDGLCDLSGLTEAGKKFLADNYLPYTPGLYPYFNWALPGLVAKADAEGLRVRMQAEG